jgi:hypothetical protein
MGDLPPLCTAMTRANSTVPEQRSVFISSSFVKFDHRKPAISSVVLGMGTFGRASWNWIDNLSL